MIQYILLDIIRYIYIQIFIYIYTYSIYSYIFKSLIDFLLFTGIDHPSSSTSNIKDIVLFMCFYSSTRMPFIFFCGLAGQFLQ